MSAARLRGVLAPITTPFDGRGELAAPAVERNVAAHVAAGVHGIVVAGSTGEAALLDETERGLLVEAARRAVPSDRLLVVGTGAESTRSALRLTRQAAERGADAVLVVAPHYYGASAMGAEALLQHYRAVADASPVPVVLYSIPKYMHFSLAPQLVHELSRHGNVIGIKDSSGDADLLSVYLNHQTDEFSVMTGSGQLLQVALARGARGGILAVSLFAAPLALEILQATGAGDALRAEALQERLTPLAKFIVAELGVPGVKAALDVAGLEGGAPRPPLLPVTRSQQRRVAELLKTAEQPLSV